MANRTQVAGRLASMPAPIVTAVTPGYNGPTVPISYEQSNGFQEAVCVPLEDGGVTLDKDNYTQTATLLSGVHGIITNIRTTLATVAVSTFAKKAAIAVTDAICSGTHAVCSAGTVQTVTGNQSMAMAGAAQTVSGIDSVAIAGASQGVMGDASAAIAGSGQIVAGNGSVSLGGLIQITSADKSVSMAGQNQYNDGDRSAIIGGKYIENIDDDCLAFGVGTSTPPTAEVYGDTYTNKNVWAKIHCDTGIIDHKKITKTAAVAVTTGLSQPTITWTDYANEANIAVILTLTVDGSAETIQHGEYIEFAIPPAIYNAGMWTYGISHTDPAVPDKVRWAFQIDESTDKGCLYNAGPDTTLTATNSLVVTVNIHRHGNCTSSYSP